MITRLTSDDLLKRLAARLDLRDVPKADPASQTAVPPPPPPPPPEPIETTAAEPDCGGPVELPLGAQHTAVGEPHEDRVEGSWTTHGPAFGNATPISQTMFGAMQDWSELALRHVALALHAQIDGDATPTELADALAVLREFQAQNPKARRSQYEPWRIAQTEADGVKRPGIDRLLRTIDPQGRKWGVALAAAGVQTDDAPASSWRVGRLGPFLDDDQLEIVLRAFARDTPGRWLQTSDYRLWAKRNPTLPDPRSPANPPIRVPRTTGPFGVWANALDGIEQGHRVSPFAGRGRPDAPRRRAGGRDPKLRRSTVSGWEVDAVRRGMHEVCDEAQRRGLPLNQRVYRDLTVELNARDCASSETRYPSVEIVLRHIARPFAAALTEEGYGAGGPGGGGRPPRAHYHEPDDDRLAAASMQIFEIGGARLSVNRYTDIRSDLIAAAAEKGDILTLPGEGILTLRFGRCPKTGGRSWPRARAYLLNWAAQHAVSIPGLASAHPNHEERAA